MFVVFLGGVFVAVGLVVLGIVLAIARWGLISSTTRSVAVLMMPPLTIAALVFLPMIGEPRHTTSTGLTITYLPDDVESSVPNLSDGANFDGFVSGEGGELWIGVRLQPDFPSDAQVVERSGRRFLVDADSHLTRVAEVVNGVQVEVQSDYLGEEQLMEIAEGLTYRRELDYYRRNADGA
jgi:hypothetical protein